MLPLRKKLPFETPAEPLDGQVYALNAGLAEWAFELTRAMPLDDSDKLKEIRSHFEGAAAQRAPTVVHGRRNFVVDLLAWEADGRLGRGVGAVFHGRQGCVCDDSDGRHGNAAVADFLARAGRVDMNRVMVLRAVSNYDRQPRRAERGREPG